MASRFDADAAVGFCETCPGRPPRDCRGERREIERRCGISRRESNRFLEGRERYNNRRQRPGSNRPRRQVQERRMTWKDKHCGPVLLQLNAANLERRMEDLNAEVENLLDDVQDYAAQIGGAVVQERLERYIAGAGARYAGSALCGPAVKVCAAAVTVVNVVSGVWGLFSGFSEVRRTTSALEETVDQLFNIRRNAEGILDAANDPAELQQVQREVSEQMAELAAADPCLSARKCFLVPYNPPSSSHPQGPASMNQSGSGTAGIFDTGPLDLSDSRGCCPGQTGHHVLPRAMMAHCPSYTTRQHNAAPTACLEGANQWMGSHGQAHDATDRLLRELHSNGQPMTLSNAIDLVTTAYTDENGVGRDCNPECIREQLERFYNTLGCTPEPVNRSGQRIGPGEESGDDDI